ncbi:MAG: hypothetical protein KDA16_00045 [Phycisphaerales bacterium]|nr:hypothetical protein [Phycisphaerales bacterium]
MITFKIKNQFFDRAKVKRELEAGKRRALSRAGAFVRTSAKSSIKSRKNKALYSSPGDPPFSKDGRLKKFILFGYDKSSDSVVIGPVGFPKSRVPSLLEFGGRVPIRGKKRIPVSSRGKGKGRRYEYAEISGVANYEPRPYMGPALKRERSKIPRAFKGSVNKG